jgi:putative methanogen marker protein 4
MAIISKFRVLAKEKSRNIGIGLGKSDIHNQNIVVAITNFLQENFSKIYVFGAKESLNHIKDLIDSNYKSSIVIIKSKIPEVDIFEYMLSKRINSIIRGSISSGDFLKSLKRIIKPNIINRLALLETVDGHQFFYGPVGIDECNNVYEKIEFIENAIKQLKLLSIEPTISVLSGGRKGDVGRNEDVDISIQNAEETVKEMKKRYPSLTISHDEILIENAVKKKSNVIIAPNGISGNLIYRTLVHLGGGKAYGAIYMNLENVIIDTSRVGEVSEIQGALLLALALSK